MVAARGLIAGGVHLHAQTPTTFGTETRRIEFTSTLEIGMLCERGAAPTAIHRGHDQMALDNAPIGIWRSDSICRSSSGERPSVVR